MRRQQQRSMKEAPFCLSAVIPDVPSCYNPLQTYAQHAELHGFLGEARCVRCVVRNSEAKALGGTPKAMDVTSAPPIRCGRPSKQPCPLFHAIHLSRQNSTTHCAKMRDSAANAGHRILLALLSKLRRLSWRTNHCGRRPCCQHDA